LTPNIQTPIEVYAFDRAGNQSALDPDDIRQVIYIKWIFVNFLYLPSVIK